MPNTVVCVGNELTAFIIAVHADQTASPFSLLQHLIMYAHQVLPGDAITIV